MSEFTPRDPGWKRRTEAAFANQPFMEFIGAELVALSPGRCEIRLPYRPELTQHHGFFHGGVIGTLADNAGGFAAGSLMEAGREVLTVEYKLNIVAPGRGEALTVTGTVVKAGRTLTVARAEVFTETEGRSKLCASAQQTLMGVPADRTR